MPVGGSKRIVIETDLELKKELYQVLDAEGLKLKHWFETAAKEFLAARAQPSLFSQSEIKEDSK